MLETSNMCVIKNVHTDNVFARMLVNFEHGALSKQEAEDVKCSLLTSNDNNGQVALVQKKNSIFKGNVNAKELCQTLLLVKSKRKSKGHLITIPTCLLTKSNENRKTNSLNKLTLSTDRRSEIANLSKIFGSKKSKRQSEIGMKMELNVKDNEIEMEKTITNITVNEEDLKEFTEDTDEIMSLLPPCNRKATEAHDVYKLENILNESDLNSLSNTAQFLIDNPPTSTDDRNSFFLSCYYKKLGSNLTVEKLGIIMYVDALLRFFKINARDLRKKDVVNIISPFSNIIGMKILKEFTVLSSGGRSRPLSVKDKVICYIIVLILLACDLKIDIDILLSCLKGCSQKKIKQLVKTVGVVPASFGSSEYVLKIPLPNLPVVPHRRSSSRGNKV